MTTIAENLQVVRARIGSACLRAGRDPGTVMLLAVSKTWPIGDIAEAFAAGQRHFGESYSHEALPKMDLLPILDWHFVGALQSNKTRPVAERFAWVHSLDRLKLAQRLSEQRDPGQAPLNVCLQVNVSGEASKAGCTPEAARELAAAVSTLKHLNLRGLMAIPEFTNDAAAQRRQFALLRQLLEHINCDVGVNMDTLSMGMSHDLEAAILEGATIVRVGTAIFGSRQNGQSSRAGGVASN